MSIPVVFVLDEVSSCAWKLSDWQRSIDSCIIRGGTGRGLPVGGGIPVPGAEEFLSGLRLPVRFPGSSCGLRRFGKSYKAFAPGLRSGFLAGRPRFAVVVPSPQDFIRAGGSGSVELAFDRRTVCL